MLTDLFSVCLPSTVLHEGLRDAGIEASEGITCRLRSSFQILCGGWELRKVEGKTELKVI
jgi:hypothetical protein